MTNKEKIDKIMKPLELEQARLDYEFKQKVANEKLAENKSIHQVDVLEFPEIIHKYSKKPRQKTVYKQSLDMTDQAGAETYSMKAIYQKYVNGEPLPMGAIKNYQYSDIGVDDQDLTDLHIVNDYYQNKYGTDLKSVLEQTLNKNDDEQNDDEQIRVAPKQPKQQLPNGGAVGDEPSGE